ncbi:IclR family transcriptional regulator [Klebsiella pneumoniae]|nr:IclR family transcriptional regulator [Klebsiella pneumoniae]
MPVFGVNDKLIAALALTGPISRLTEDRREQGISQLMHATASRLSQKMGASKPFCQQFYGETQDTAEESL